jgi:hypothetical protein
MDYPAYIKKSKDIVINKNGAKRMDFKEFIDGLKSLIKQAEDTPEEEPAVEKEDDKTEEAEEPVVEKADEETTEEEATKEEDEAEIKKEDKAEEEEVADEEDEAEITKEDSDLEARVAKLEEQIAELLKEDTDAENPDPEVKPEDEDTPKITKSEKVVITNESEHVTQTNYYEMTGRDPVTGKKLR